MKVTPSEERSILKPVSVLAVSVQARVIWPEPAVAVRFVGAAGDAFDVHCDVFSPCATGAVLNASTIPRLRCRIVAGAANNQLGEPEDAQRLTDAGILYAPDYVVNAGGVLHLAGYERLGWTPDEMAARLEGIGATLQEIFFQAEREGLTTEAAARRVATDRIASSARA